VSLAALPDPPYVAVVFTSVRTASDAEGYARAAAAMDALAAVQPGYLAHEGARDPATGLGVTVSYWRTEADARAWKAVADHEGVQRLGREQWYADYRVVVASVSRAYGPPSASSGAGPGAEPPA
jgi:heme-degrading monooxygenase HmoA